MQPKQAQKENLYKAKEEKDVHGEKGRGKFYPGCRGKLDSKFDFFFEKAGRKGALFNLVFINFRVGPSGKLRRTFL